MPTLSPDGCRLVAACLITALLAAAPMPATASATLTVRARVVEACQTRLPDLAPPHARRDLPVQVRDLVVHDCRRPVHPHVTARWSGWPPTRHQHTSAHRDRHDGRDSILVTISY